MQLSVMIDAHGLKDGSVDVRGGTGVGARLSTLAIAGAVDLSAANAAPGQGQR